MCSLNFFLVGLFSRLWSSPGWDGDGLKHWLYALEALVGNTEVNNKAAGPLEKILS